MDGTLTHIRVTRATKAALEQLGRLWAADLATDWGPAPDKMHVSADRVIAELIRRDEAHRTRARKGRKKPAAGDADGVASASVDPAGGRSSSRPARRRHGQRAGGTDGQTPPGQLP
jgi:hypothetical protein